VCKEVLITVYIVRRLLQVIPVLLAVSVLTFGLIRLAPGDPAQVALRNQGAMLTVEAIAQMRAQMGLNDPLPVQYARWLGRALRFDFGNSVRSGQPVSEAITRRLVPTLQLAAAGLVVSLVVAFPLGMLAAVRPHSWVDHLSRLLALAGASMPSFWLGLLLIYYFAVVLDWLPAMGRKTPEHLVLPALTLGLWLAPTFARLLRAGLLDVLGEDYIRTARAKGVIEHNVIFRHALRNALLPLFTVLGLTAAHLLGGVVIVETIFAWPGLGQLTVDAILTRDFPAVQALILLLSVAFVFANLLVDLSYPLLDPRLRLPAQG
jgi:peptide/nickel transport system permease protein